MDSSSTTGAKDRGVGCRLHLLVRPEALVRSNADEPAERDDTGIANARNDDAIQPARQDGGVHLDLMSQAVLSLRGHLDGYS